MCYEVDGADGARVAEICACDSKQRRRRRSVRLSCSKSSLRHNRPHASFFVEKGGEASMRPICDEGDLKAETVATNAAAPIYNVA